MIEVQLNNNGSYTALALVWESGTPSLTWYEHCTYYGHSKSEIKKLFRQYLSDKQLTMVK